MPLGPHLLINPPSEPWVDVPATVKEALAARASWIGSESSVARASRTSGMSSMRRRMGGWVSSGALASSALSIGALASDGFA
jgi:hypothetical protein